MRHTGEARIWGAAAVFAACAAAWLWSAPQVGWLVKAQAKSAVGATLPGWNDDRSESGRQAQRRRDAQIAAQYPGDFQTQWAFTLRNVPANNPPFEHNNPSVALESWSGQKGRVGHDAAERLRGLLPRFADRPALHASLLRNLSLSDVHLRNRRDDAVLTPDKTPAFSDFDPKANQAEALQKWEAACLAGQKTDTQNAFFPAMRAVGLFAQNRDEEAEAALLEINQTAYYRDYSGDETQALWHFLELENGEPGAIPRLGEYAGLLLPHLAAMRQLSRLATVHAMQAEKSGNVERGLQMRRAMAHLGEAMQTSRSSTILTALVGDAVREISYLSPGGSAPLPTGKTWHADVRNAYIAYLRRTGHDGDVRLVEVDRNARKQIGAVLKASDSLPENDRNLSSYGHLAAGWAVGIGLLTNALVIGLAGVLAAAYLRFWPTLTKPFRLGIGVLGGATVCGALLALGAYSGAISAAGMGVGLTNAFGDGPHSDKMLSAAVAVRVASVVGILLPLSVWFAAASRFTRVSVSVGIARGFAKTGLPTSAILLMLYAGVAVWTANHEAKQTNFLRQSAQNEGRYLARRTGTTWPDSILESGGEAGK